MASDLTALQQAVAQTAQVEQSAVTLIQGLAQQIADLKNDPVALQALSDQLTQQSAALSAAVTANTPTPTPPAP